jgi:uncharacterized membrane protein
VARTCGPESLADSPERLIWIDALRGLAIILMIPGNFAPYLAEPHSTWFRVSVSFAAPIFVMLSAGMVVLNAEKHNFSYYLKRGAAIIIVGMLVDVLVWHILPGTSIDVLYTIGFALPLIYLLRNWPLKGLLGITFAIVLLASSLRGLLGFHTDVLQIAVLDPHLPSMRRLVGSWLLDGWFPLLPWFAFATFGVVFFRVIRGTRSWDSGAFPIGASGLMAAGFLLLFLPVDQHLVANLMNGGVLDSRNGYSEIFYPATPAFFIASLGVVMGLAVVMRRIPVGWPSRTLAFFGNYSMLVYVLHLAIGHYLIKAVLEQRGMDAIGSGPVFLLVVLLTLGGIAVICGGISVLKRRCPPHSMFFKVIFGR